MPYGLVKDDDESNDEYLAAIPAEHPWRQLILKLHEQLVQLDPEYEIVQVKEKFGSLRYYYSSVLQEHIPEVSAAMSTAIRIAETESYALNRRS